ncbi:rhomboid family intramembrane serine protease [Elizabethkingia anophelis]|uniref:rhomboid family intramembrane serine protease n=1 Tax=Elizabethkingia anophelis TaxID=1117645 RepID=UPI000530F7D9|nr:rhomboid family intramembrane serine protease [Elizabethkingia anophelis]AQW99658.1 rhomboid family intramembrane serine protease [Elizabethkingia anophelis]AQX90199.1 rhomboid family intramembrane serine protease [Elizabethkingia anophelis]ASV79512.1 rhomboid family intramembrane serine protease [Elizabethkingia anophelis]EHM7980589.1 rhomboid family intramembrane serine protease [Elizabethkingia anophelis]EHM8031808.1 rhomboid family intramembrane serine protease [Elizabethkingia anopheli
MDLLVIIIIVATALVSFKGFNDRGFFSQYMFQVGAIQRNKEYIRLLTSGFLHADIMHLLFNMLTLFFFGGIVTHYFGKVGFVLIYFGAILAGNLFSLFIYKNNPMYSAIGASGGVSGILFAAIAMNPYLEIGVFFVLPLKGFIFGALYFGYSVYMMLNPKQWDNLGHAAHLGGSVVGLVYAFISFPMNTLEHLFEILIMSLPLLYLAFRILFNKGGIR